MHDARATRRLSIVTVVYSRELDLLRLQARSIARFSAPDDVESVQVIVNDREEAACAAAVEAMRPAYGPFADRLEVLCPDDLIALRPRDLRPRSIGGHLSAWFTRHRALYPLGVKGGWRGNRGWSTQQALKLLVARHGASAFVLLLDAKNHLVAPIELSDLVSPADRARCYMRLANDKQWSWIRASFGLLGAPLPARDAPVPPTVTPFVLERDVLLSTLDALERRVGPAEAFFTRRKPGLRKRTRGSEFMMIFAHVVAAYGAWDAKFDPGLMRPATIHRRSDDAQIERALSLVESGAAKVFGVHGSRIGTLTPAAAYRLRALWASRQLDAEEILSRLGQEPTDRTTRAG